jgi:hypothetical protein
LSLPAFDNVNLATFLESWYIPPGTLAAAYVKRAASRAAWNDTRLSELAVFLISPALEVRRFLWCLRFPPWRLLVLFIVLLIIYYINKKISG